MKEIVYVGLGGALGAIARYTISLIYGSKLNEVLDKLASGASNGISLFLPTFGINMLACFMIGLLFPIIHENKMLNNLFLIGCLGGFSTFSSFGMESYKLFSEGYMASGLIYMIGSVIGGVIFVVIGLYIAKLLGYAR